MEKYSIEKYSIHFEKFYIGKLVRGSDSTRRVPVYQIKMWNVVNRVKSNKDKTNNSLESWHKVFSFDALIHPTFNKLLENLRVEKKHTHIICQQLLSGDTYDFNKKTRAKNQAIQDAIHAYSFEYLFTLFDQLILIDSN